MTHGWLGTQNGPSQGHTPILTTHGRDTETQFSGALRLTARTAGSDTGLSGVASLPRFWIAPQCHLAFSGDADVADCAETSADVAPRIRPGAVLDIPEDAQANLRRAQVNGSYAFRTFNGSFQVDRVVTLSEDGAAKLAKRIADAETAWNRQALKNQGIQPSAIEYILPEISTVQQGVLEAHLRDTQLAFGRLFDTNGNPSRIASAFVSPAFRKTIFIAQSARGADDLAHEAVHIGQINGAISSSGLKGHSIGADRDYSDELARGELFSSLSAELQAEWVEHYRP